MCRVDLGVVVNHIISSNSVICKYAMVTSKSTSVRKGSIIYSW